MTDPKEIEKDAKDYNAGAWLDYSIMELGQWVHLLATRADHRSNPEKRAKDLLDARNYWRMMGARLDELDKGK